MRMPKPIRRKSRKRAESELWWFRRRVPDDCQPVLGIREWWASLETTEYRIAERAILSHIVRTDQIIADIRAGTYRRYQDEQLERIAIAWAGEATRAIEADAMLPPGPGIEPGEGLPLATESDFDRSMQGFLERLDWSGLGPQIEPNWPDYKRLREHCFEHHYVQQVASRPRVLERLEGQQVKLKPGEDPGFMETFEAYLRERQPRSKTAGEFRKSVTDFLSLHGKDIGIRNLTKAQVVEYKNLLLGKPNRLTEKQRKLSLPELIQQVQGQDLETISAGTVNKSLVPIHATLEYAVQHGLIETNPAVGVKAKRSKSTIPPRLPYSIDDLNRIFGSSLWAKPREAWTVRQWLPLLALFTGSRLEELAQLYVSDVHEQDGISYLNIATIEEGQNVKNLSSIRRVPLHPEMIRLGFLEYVAKRRKAKEKMLFELTPYRGYYGANFTKWYGRQRSKFGIADPRKVLHSMRHSFKDAGRDEGLDKAILDALQGHSDSSASGQYGSGYSLKALNRAMKRVKFPGLKLDRIKG